MCNRYYKEQNYLLESYWVEELLCSKKNVAWQKQCITKVAVAYQLWVKAFRCVLCCMLIFISLLNIKNKRNRPLSPADWSEVASNVALASFLFQNQPQNLMVLNPKKILVTVTYKIPAFIDTHQISHQHYCKDTLWEIRV